MSGSLINGPLGCGFNRQKAIVISTGQCNTYPLLYREEDVENETKTKNILHRKTS